MFIITLHLFFDSLVISIVRFDFLRDVTVYTKDTSAVDEDLGKDVEDAVVNFSGWWEHEGDECHDDATGEEGDGGPLFEFRFHVSLLTLIAFFIGDAVVTFDDVGREDGVFLLPTKKHQRGESLVPYVIL